MSYWSKARRLFEEEISKCKEIAKENDEMVGKICQKERHSWRVVEYGNEVMDNEKIRNKDMVMTALLLHDIGRFQQSLKNSFRDDLTKINHANLGAKIVRNNGFPKKIIEAVAEHNNPFYDGTNELVWLVTEADQLAIMSEFDWQVKRDDWKNDDDIEELKKLYIEKQPIDTSRYLSKEAWLLAMWNWERRFKYKTSKVIYKRIGVEEKIKKELKPLLPATIDDFTEGAA